LVLVAVGIVVAAISCYGVLNCWILGND